jgi:hypothetical protein
MFVAVELETISPEVTGLVLRNSLHEREKLIAHLYAWVKKLNSQQLLKIRIFL